MNCGTSHPIERKQKPKKKNKKSSLFPYILIELGKKRRGGGVVGSRIEKNAGGEIGGQFWFLVFFGVSGRAPLPAAAELRLFLFLFSCGVGRPSTLRRSLSLCFSLFCQCMVWFAAAAAAATSVVL